VIGAIANSTKHLRLGTGVTAPLIRVHPAIVAQAAATSAAMMPGRFILGVGTGENLNEHIVGTHWPEVDVRLEMLEEAVQVIRKLWTGESLSHRGRHYRVENARIYSRPPQPPPIYMAAAGQKSATVAGKIADGLISTAPNKRVVDTFNSHGGTGKPRYAQMTVCVAEDEQTARRTATQWWPTAGITGELTQELKLPAHFEQAAANVTEDAVAKVVVCSQDPGAHLQRIQEYADAGFDHVYVHQTGPDQERFFSFYQSKILPRLARQAAA
jgi:G6PDH family F420-dependent oxidoreductase